MNLKLFFVLTLVKQVCVLGQYSTAFKIALNVFEIFLFVCRGLIENIQSYDLNKNLLELHLNKTWDFQQEYNPVRR